MRWLRKKEGFIFYYASSSKHFFRSCSAHGLGTAALSAKEPEALPFCAIAYALTGIFGSLICSVPAVRQSLLAIVGWHHQMMPIYLFLQNARTRLNCICYMSTQQCSFWATPFLVHVISSFFMILVWFFHLMKITN